jgi:hypothetical protein
MRQSQAQQWQPGLLPGLRVALRTLGDAPTRSLSALAQRLGVSEVDATTVRGSLAAEPAPVVTAPVATPEAPLLPMTARRVVRPQDPAAQRSAKSSPPAC